MTDGPVAPLPGEPMPIMAEVRAPRPAELLELQVPSQWILGVGAATSRDQAQGATGSVAQYELQPGKTAAVASTQGQKEACEKAVAEQLPEQGGPVEVQLKLCQEESWAEARGRPEAEMERACGETGGNGEGEQESCGNGVKRPAGIATSREERGDFVGEVEDEGDEDDPQCELRSQAGHPVPVGHESRRRRIWEPGKLHSELRQ